MKPSWSDAPEWAQWLAQDENGEWHWYREKPQPGEVFRNEWLLGGAVSPAGDSKPNPNWRDTLERRPMPCVGMRVDDVPHTAEPWREGKGLNSIVADSPAPGILGSAAVAAYGGHMIAESINVPNRRRIIACVNACKGLGTKWLEGLLAKGRTINDEAQEWREAHRRYHEPTTCNRGHESLPLKLWDCPTCSEIRREERARLIEALRPFASAGGLPYGANWKGLVGNDLRNARMVLRELDEWSHPQTPTEEFSDSTLRAQVEALAHEPSRDELNDMHEPEYEMWAWSGANPSDPSRALLVSSDKEGDIRVEDGGPINLNDDLEQTEEHYGDDPEDNLGIELIVGESIPDRARCKACGGYGRRWLTGLISDHCHDCNGTGRRHVNGKPFYTAEEVAEFARTEREEPYPETHCGFPGGMNKP